MLQFDKYYRYYYWLIIPVVFSLLCILIIHLTIGNKELFFLLNKSAILKNDILWANITVLGDALFFAAFLLLFAKKYPEFIWAAFITAIFGALFSLGGKWFFGVPRPDSVLSLDFFNKIGQINSDYSFPSGHTTSVYMFAGLLIFTITTNVWRFVLILIPLIVGISRIMVGAHWPIDVFGGIISGLLAAYLGLVLYNKWPAGKNTVLRYFLLFVIIVCTLYLILFYDSGYPDAILLQRGLASLLLLIAFLQFLPFKILNK